MSNLTDVLLDFSTPFDQNKVNIFDQVVQAMYSNKQQDVSAPQFNIADAISKQYSEPIQAGTSGLAHRRQNPAALTKHDVQVYRAPDSGRSDSGK